MRQTDLNAVVMHTTSENDSTFNSQPLGGLVDDDVSDGAPTNAVASSSGVPSYNNQLHWVTIQRSTFTNWVRDRLTGSDFNSGSGSVDATMVNDLQSDLCDGWLLCRLVEALQRRRVGGHPSSKPLNRHQRIDNVNLALKAMADDGIRLINIGMASQILF